MPDEPTRSAQGKPPPQRRPGPAPEWWGELLRPDLPDDGGGPPAPRRSVPAPEGKRRPASAVWRSTLDIPTPAATGVSWLERLRTAIAVLAIAAAIVLIGWLGVGEGTARATLVALLVFGVPAAAAACAVGVMARRSS